MAKNYLHINLTGNLEEHVRAESKRLNISHAAYVTMILSQVIFEQNGATDGLQQSIAAQQSFQDGQQRSMMGQITLSSLNSL